MLEPSAARGERAVLEDATGRRGRWMRRLGRTLTVLLLAWLVVLVGGGLGLTPVANLPFGDALRPSKGPEPLRALPKPRKPPAEDLRPALPLRTATSRAPQTREAAATATPIRAPRTRSAGPVKRAKPVRRRPAPRQTVRVSAPPPNAPTSPGRSGATPPTQGTVTPPGQASTTPGRSAEAPGHSLTTAPGSSGVAPGQTATTMPGRSGSAPGRTKTETVTATTTAPATTTLATKPGADPPGRP